MRRHLDAYYTPGEVAIALVATLPHDLWGVYAPHAGGGAFASAISALRPGGTIRATDVDPITRGLRGQAAITGQPARAGAPDHLTCVRQDPTPATCLEVLSWR